MPNGEIDWIIITGAGNKEIGALGFIGNEVAVITAFYDDRDGDKDGKVSWGEWFASKVSPLSLKNRAVTEVAMAARFDMRVIERDSSFYQEAGQMFVKFAAGLVADGIYAVYFSRGVGAIAKPIAGRVASNIVAQFVIRKGMEKAVKAAYDDAVRP